MLLCCLFYPKKKIIYHNGTAKLQFSKRSSEQVKGQPLQRSNISVRTPAVTTECFHTHKSNFYQPATPDYPLWPRVPYQQNRSNSKHNTHNLAGKRFSLRASASRSQRSQGGYRSTGGPSRRNCSLKPARAAESSGAG